MTTVHPPFDSRIFHKECKGLVEADFNVSLIVVHDHNESCDGVNIIALPEPKGRLDRMLFTSVRLYRQALKLKADIYHFHDPELLPVGLMLKLAGKKVVYDVHEDVPLDMLQKLYLPAWSRNTLSHLARFAHWVADRAFDAIVTVTPTVAKPFRYARLIRNFPIIDEFLGDGVPYLQRQNCLAYVGVVDPMRGSDHMRKAAADLDCTLLMAGPTFDPSLQQELDNLPADDSTRYLGVLDRKGVRELLHSARAGVVILSPENTGYVDSYPIKLFEYMAAGLPVIAADFPVIRGIVEPANCGLLVDPTDQQQITAAFRWILDNPEAAQAMGQRGRQAVLADYNWAGERDKLADLYSQLLGAQPS